jgi:prepilin-type processing-associated H-X9-DG protein
VFSYNGAGRNSLGVDALPPLTMMMAIKPGELVQPTGQLPVGWPILLLPAMDGTQLLRRIQQNAEVSSGQSPDAIMKLGTGERIYVNRYTCPNDSDSHQIPGGLSYVVNVGFMPRSLYHDDPQGRHRLGGLSWDDNDQTDEAADVPVSAATGVIWRPSEDFAPTMDYIGTGDGTTNSLLLTENLQAGNWWDTEATQLGFGLPVADVNGRVPFGKGTFFESVKKPLNTGFVGSTLTTAQPLDWKIDSDRKAATGTRPRPGSNHGGSVNAIFCDGSATVINANIDPHVYVKLLTSHGVSHGESVLTGQNY